MNKTFLLILFLSFYSGYSQNYKIDKKTLIINDNIAIKVGEDLKLGKGSDSDGTFRYIQVNEKSMFRAYNTNGTNRGVQEANSLPNKYNGLNGKILKFEERGNQRTGFKVFIIVGIGEVKRYQVDLFSALDSKEILIDGYLIETESKAKETKSLAEELKELNKLKEEGLLTEDEFIKAKEKLLSK